MYAIGEVIPRDYQEAMKWFRLGSWRGSGHGDIEGTCFGIMYALSPGVFQDFQEMKKVVRPHGGAKARQRSPRLS